MSRLMLIDSLHPEQTRVVVTEKGRIEEFDVESNEKKQTIGNIYLAKITRIEPSLQAAFVEYGSGRQGFLPFSEIHTDYYQIPKEDREKILDEENTIVQEHEKKIKDLIDAKESLEEVEDKVECSKYCTSDEQVNETIENSIIDDYEIDIPKQDIQEEKDPLEEDDEVLQRKLARHHRENYKKYKIQEVIKKRQIILIQVVKSERGNKGASLTSYISLAGRYCVLMPNTAHGGGISRKISNINDRRNLKEIIKNFDVQKGMGLIIRTAGSQKSKTDLKKDYEYLLRLWNNIRDNTMESTAPSLIYEEGSLMKRAVRDIYSRDISKIIVQGEKGYKKVREFMRMMAPSQVRNVQAYKEPMPLFSHYKVEKQIEEITDSIVQLKSGGYLVVNQTEALVAIDVNSGRSTNEYSVEKTALNTNLEAADEVIRQLTLRDLAGLVVIDFIDMIEVKNIRSVEKRMRDNIKKDRARIQVTRISNFGLMEMTRQRLRPAVQDIIQNICPTCNGAGYVISAQTGAFRVLRRIFEDIAVNNPKEITATTNIDIAYFILNNKKSILTKYEDDFDVKIIIEGRSDLLHKECNISMIEKDDLSLEEANIESNDIDGEKITGRRKKSRRRNRKSDDLEIEEKIEENNEQILEEKTKKKERKTGQKRRKHYLSSSPRTYKTKSGNEVIIENSQSVTNQTQDQSDYISSIEENEIEEIKDDIEKVVSEDKKNNASSTDSSSTETPRPARKKWWKSRFGL